MHVSDQRNEDRAYSKHESDDSGVLLLDDHDGNDEGAHSALAVEHRTSQKDALSLSSTTSYSLLPGSSEGNVQRNHLVRIESDDVEMDSDRRSYLLVVTFFSISLSFTLAALLVYPFTVCARSITMLAEVMRDVDQNGNTLH